MSENTAFDPNAPEGAGEAGSQYLSRKDVKWIGGTVIVLGIMMIPIYITLKEKAYKSTCVKNLNATMEALSVYAAQHDDRFPPLHDQGSDGPSVDQNGLPYTWISDINSLKSDRASFVCQTAADDEASMSVDPATGEAIPSTFGFYAPYSTYSVNMVDNPDTVVILAETSNGGSQGSYDPKPYGTTKWDGYGICWDNSNDWPDEETSAVTRLALRGSSGGTKDIDKAMGRHSGTIHAITASRLLINMKPGAMITDYNRAKFTLAGAWQEPVNRQR